MVTFQPHPGNYLPSRARIGTSAKCERLEGRGELEADGDKMAADHKMLQN